MKQTVKILLLSSILVSFIVLVLSFYFGFESIFDYMFALVAEGQKKEDILSWITKWHFVMLQAILALIAIILSLFVYKLNAIYPYIERFCSHLWRAIKGVFADVSTKNAMLVLLFPLVASIYFGATIPVSYDEAYTYLYFTSKPFYICIIYYPLPNNHVLHSILSNISDCIPFLNVLFALRLPAILASILAWIVTFSFVKRSYSEKTALFATALSSMLFLSIYYSYMSRGYAMMFLFFVIALYAVYNILKNGNKTHYWAFFSMSGMLGMYTIPSFLYPFATLNVILLIYNFRFLKKQLIYNAIAAFGTLLLYTPIIILKGFGALSDNQFVKPKPRLEVLESLPFFMQRTLAEITGFHFLIVVCILLVSLLLLLKNKRRRDLGLFFIFMLAPFLLLILHSTIPFPRTFAYYGFVIVFFFAVSLSSYIDTLPQRLLLIGLLVVQLSLFVHFKVNIAAFETYNTYEKETNDMIVAKDKTYYMHNSLSIINYQFEMHVRGYDYHNNVRYEYFVPEVDADTIQGFDYVVIDRENDETKIRKPFYSNPVQNVYKR